ncbi:MAG: tyrosine-protein phosphatase [Gammaproteobacteria bacterium]|nr:tyrosine-protein phosphatase [Gammaproteobacteria bacterium]
MTQLDQATLLNAHAHRHVHLEGARNVRDLGGLPVSGGGRTRTGVIYRADTLASLTDAGVASLHSLGLKTVIDLRTADERARAPDRLPATRLTVHSLGFMPSGNGELLAGINNGTYDPARARTSMLRQYRNLALDHLAELRQLFAILLDGDQLPVLFHCASGKDRTGIAAALTLLAVEVPPDLIVEDYTVSNYQRRAVDLFGPGAASAVIEPVMAADPDYLRSAFAAMQERYGSMDAYLLHGLELDGAARDRLKTLLVD